MLKQTKADIPTDRPHRLRARLDLHRRALVLSEERENGWETCLAHEQSGLEGLAPASGFGVKWGETRFEGLSLSLTPDAGP